MHKENGPIYRKKYVNGQWTKEIITPPPYTDFTKQKKKSRKKKKHHKYEKLPDKFYSSHKWAKLRYEILKRSSGRCELCGRSSKEGVILQVDHIKPKHKYPHLAFDPNNLQVLCSACNWGKYGDDETDWRAKDSLPGWLSNEKEWSGLKVVK